MLKLSNLAPKMFFEVGNSFPFLTVRVSFNAIVNDGAKAAIAVAAQTQLFIDDHPCQLLTFMTGLNLDLVWVNGKSLLVDDLHHEALQPLCARPAGDGHFVSEISIVQAMLPG